MKLNSKSKLNYSLDFRGTITSICLLELSRLFDEMKKGNMLTITIPNKDIIADICKVLPKSSYEMKITDQGSLVKMVIMKKCEPNPCG